MKMPRSLIAAVGIAMVGVAPLLQAAPGPQGQGQGNEQHTQGPQGQAPGQQGRGQDQQPGQGQQHQQGGQGGNGSNGNAQASRGQSGRQGGRPPQDFAPIRQTISEHRESFGRGNALPANIRVERGHPLPRGYGRPLNAAALNQLPHYEGYQWRRLGSDVVLVAIGTGLVYEILSGVLN